MGRRTQEVQLDSRQRWRIDVDTYFNPLHGPEALLHLHIPPAKINGLDVLIAQVFEDIEKKKNPGRKVAPNGIVSHIVSLQTVVVDGTHPVRGRFLLEVENVDS